MVAWTVKTVQTNGNAVRLQLLNSYANYLLICTLHLPAEESEDPKCGVPQISPLFPFVSNLEMIKIYNKSGNLVLACG